MSFLRHFSRKTQLLIGLTLLVMAAAAGGLVWAAISDVPNGLVYQGRITTAAGSSIAAGDYSIKLEFFDVETGGNPKCDWTTTSVTITSNGYFRTEVGNSKTGSGSCTDIQSLLRQYNELYVAISLKPIAASSMETLSPRVRLSAQPRAHHAQYAVTAANGVPPGTIIAYGGSTAPEGWLLCDGQTVERTTYASLFAALGTAFGSGNGLTTFHLPDLRGRFLRGRNASSGFDPDATSRTALNSGGNTGDQVGSLQTDAVQKHKHTDSGHTHSLDSVSRNANTIAYVTAAAGPGSYNTGTGTANLGDPTDSSTGAGTPRLSKETRPANVSINYIIKY